MKSVSSSVFTETDRRGQQTYGLRGDYLLEVPHLQPRKGLIESGSPSQTDEFFMKTICSPFGPTKISYKKFKYLNLISKKFAFTVKSSHYTLHWSFTKAMDRGKNSEGVATSE